METINISWHWKDILNQDETLTKKECCEILERVDRYHDANEGVNWEVIDLHIHMYKQLVGKDEFDMSNGQEQEQ